MKCKYCGHEIPDGGLYCDACGNEVRIVPDYNPLDDMLTEQVRQMNKMKGKKIRIIWHMTVPGWMSEVIRVDVPAEDLAQPVE